MPKIIHRSTNLSAEATSFVGRRHELAQVRKRLTAARLVTLVGPGGVGKTRLAIRSATELERGFPGGAWLVELAELADPALLGHAVIAALDLRDQTATEPVTLLRSYLRDKQLLLVIDNCEHLLDEVARLISELLVAAPEVRVIATSREPLSVNGEHVLPVPPLQLPAPHPGLSAQQCESEAVRLFVERAAAASGSFELSPANQAAVVDLCRRLDGLPLAIELAAVRTRALSPEQIRDRLSHRFDLLTGGCRAALPRHQTLRATIEWSYDLLTPPERTLLARLCVFAGRFTLDAVEAVCCDDLPGAHPLDLLSSLLDKSLLAKEDAAGTAYYRLHETMREYARLELRETGEEDAVERRCADYYLAQCRKFAVEGRYRLLHWLSWTELEVDNIRTVLRRCADRQDLDRGVDLATCLIWYWVTRATTEGAHWLDELLTRDGAPAAHPWAHFVRGFLAVLHNDPATAVPALDRAVSAARRAGQPVALAQSLAMASIAANLTRDHASAQRLLDQAHAVARDLDDLGAVLTMHQARSLNSLVDGDLDAARSAADEGARLSREAGDLYSLDMMLMNQGFAGLIAGECRESEQRFTEALRIARQLDDRVAQCYLIGALGCSAATTGRPQLAARLLGAMERMRGDVGAGVHPGIAPSLAHATTSVTTALGSATFDTQFRAGQQLSREAAVRLALREDSRQAPAAPHQNSTGILGKREVAVARLVVDGLSNKDIGSRLFISERTVETHIRNILNRLDFTSRTQIAVWMTAQDHHEDLPV
ncbi:LuxR C-terminal-related transcriptional regulator [Kitasatospora sp. NPDC097691]|uniref:helix-turn-helix transcriptional regulator n=1 Tax=Kitasatospora sp. NPDC097691 TaxID=3157231 RepID=UPI003324E939